MRTRVALVLPFVAAAALGAPAHADPAPADRAHADPARTDGGWPRGTLADAGLAPARLAELEAAARAGRLQRIGSVAIARHGKLVYEAYFDGDAATLRDTRSATKSITGALAGLAIAAGKLDGADARVLPLVPGHARKLQNPDPRKDRITVEDLLTMSGPLECDDWNDASRGNEERMYLVEDWSQFILDLPVRGRMRVGEEVEAPPYGRWFSYCTGGVFLLGELLGRVTGERLDRFARTALFAPLGIGRVEWVFSPLGLPQAGGGLRMTTTDLLKVAQLYLDGGVWQGKRIIADGWVRRSLSPQARIDGDTEYGYLWWLKSFGPRKLRAFFMSGNGGNKIVGVPALDLAVAITSTNYNTRGMHEQTERILVDYVLAAVAE
jgi:CubicO group peptidase (beta-lactamase class C family)